MYINPDFGVDPQRLSYRRRCLYRPQHRARKYPVEDKTAAILLHLGDVDFLNPLSGRGQVAGQPFGLRFADFRERRVADTLTDVRRRIIRRLPVPDNVEFHSFSSRRKKPGNVAGVGIIVCKKLS